MTVYGERKQKMKGTGRLNKAGLTAISLLGVIIMTFLTGMAWIYTIRMFPSGTALIEKDSLGGNALYLLLTLLLVYGIYRVCSSWGQKTLSVIAFLLTVLLIGGIFYLIESASATEIVADQAQIIFGAEWLLDERYEEIYNYPYFRVYPYQLLASKFFAGIIRFFGRSSWESLYILQRVNAVCVGITFYTGMYVIKELFEDIRIEGIYLLVAIPFAPMYIYALFIYGEPMGVCSAVVAIYFYLLIKREKRLKRWKVILCWIGLALCLWTVCLMRSVLMIVWIAIFILEFLTSLRKKDWLQFLYVIVVLGVSLGGQRLYYHSIEENTGISLDEGAPSILWVAMGMQGDDAISENPGSYNGYNWNTFTENMYDVNASIQQGKADIYGRLSEWRANAGGGIIILQKQDIESMDRAFL